MNNNIMNLVSAVKKANEEVKRSNENIVAVDKKTYEFIDTLKERKNTREYISARKSEVEAFDRFNREREEARKNKEHHKNIVKALYFEISHEAIAIIANNLLDNREKIDNIPARYKKVKTIIECISCENIKAYYNEYYHAIEIAINGDNLPYEKNSYYLTTGFNEPVIDFERCEKLANKETVTADEIAQNVINFELAQERLTELSKEYEAKRDEIISGNNCNGLSFK